MTILAPVPRTEAGDNRNAPPGPCAWSWRRSASPPVPWRTGAYGRGPEMMLWTAPPPTRRCH